MPNSGNSSERRGVPIAADSNDISVECTRFLEPLTERLNEAGDDLVADGVRGSRAAVEGLNTCCNGDRIVVIVGFEHKRSAFQIAASTSGASRRASASADGFSRRLHACSLSRQNPAANGPRYATLGNCMAVPVLQWIGERIAYVIGA